MLGNDNHIRRAWRGAFTLIELLVVIAIAAVLIGLLLAALQRVRQASYCMTCQNNLKQWALAAHNHHDTQGKFPTGFQYAIKQANGRYANGTNWVVELFPFVDQQNVQQRWDYADARNNISPGKSALSTEVLKLLLCPSDIAASHPIFYYPGNEPYQWAAGFYALSSYAGNAGRRSYPPGDFETRDGIFFPNSKIRMTEVTDGTSNTLLFGERSHYDPNFDRVATSLSATVNSTVAGAGMWAATCCPLHHLLSAAARINYQTPPFPIGGEQQLRDRLCAFGSGHPGGANFAFADGSVHFLNDQISLTTLQALSTRARGEIVESAGN
jgi:prepilin-type N-terminal cleavage/methylation domain-containing protein/prepilin-type processing-associated H-X9-DG protein